MRRFVVLLVVLMFLPAPVAAQSTSAQLAEIGWQALRSNDGDKAETQAIATTKARTETRPATSPGIRSAPATRYRPAPS